MREIEAMVAKDPDVDRYTTLSGGGTGFQALYGGDSSSTVTAYLKKKRSVSTKEKAKAWQKLLETRPDEVITVKSLSDANFGASEEDVKTNEGYEVILKGADLQSLKEKSDAIVTEMQKKESLPAQNRVQTLPDGNRTQPLGCRLNRIHLHKKTRRGIFQTGMNTGKALLLLHLRDNGIAFFFEPL